MNTIIKITTRFIIVVIPFTIYSTPGNLTSIDRERKKLHKESGKSLSISTEMKSHVKSTKHTAQIEEEVQSKKLKGPGEFHIPGAIV